MTLTTLAWLGMAAYAAHILEEYTFDWRNWARSVLHLPAEWNDFYVTNCIVVAFGIAQAMLATVLPIATLGYAGLILINGVFMHIWPFIRTGGRFSPGLFTSVILFVPLGVATYWTAWSTGLASIPEMILGLILGGACLGYPIGMLILRTKPYFRQDAAA